VQQVPELFTKKTEAEIAAELQECRPLEITELDLQWIQVLSEGWATPLTGFMREEQFLQV